MSQSAVRPAPATFEVTTDHAVTVLTATGELDNQVVDRLGHALAEAIGRRPKALLLDLSRIAFCSAQTLRVLLDAHIDARAAGVACAMVSTHPTVVRPIRLLRLDHLLQVHPDLEAAWRRLALLS
ncbi:STAS domain-containing protein [Amycolatopsis magusensis]|uniref:STAS domain-containing protein n=1 Tax=Amycolatopsis magusensis TaxID=882444 RepID=UPI0024A8E24B|nr:STAS domain-containing protein [Amycolatopsis magusensis]MDI5974562.1 STAS domain-containing protein [Amycolatopsis magusensis]